MDFTVMFELKYTVKNCLPAGLKVFYRKTKYGSNILGLRQGSKYYSKKLAAVVASTLP